MGRPKGSANAPKEEAPPLESIKTLWPIDLPIIGGTGEYASGKTIFGLTISPGARTCCYDFEKSAAPYMAMGHKYVDVPVKMLEEKPSGYKPIDIFKWWRDDVSKIKTGQFDVIHLDTASEIEEGFTDYVRQNHGEYGYSAAQFSRGEGLLWAAMKSAWKMELTRLATKIQSLYFTVHLKQKWVGGAPTRERVPKGKSTLMELASLFLYFDRNPVKGVVLPEPAAHVVKTRLTKITIGENGSMTIVPVLPPRIPMATPARIREYMLNPPNPSNLKDGEKAVEETITEAEILQMRIEAATAETATESIKLDRESRFAAGAAKRAAASAKSNKDQAEESASTEQENAGLQAAAESPTATKTEIQEVDDQIERNGKVLRLKELLLLLEASDAWTEAMLKKRGVVRIDQLTNFQIGEIVDKLAEKAAARKEASPATTPQ